MRDEIFDRDYQAGRDALHDGIDRLIEALKALKVLYRLQFDAPWKNDVDIGPSRPLDRGGHETGSDRPWPGIAAQRFRLIGSAIADAFRGLSGASDPDCRCTKIHYAGWR